MLIWLALACAPPAYRIPGPLGQLGVGDRPTLETPRPPRQALPTPGDGIADAAVFYLGKGVLRCDGEQYRMDCSGFVDAAHARAGIDLGHANSAALWAIAGAHGVAGRAPRVGDTVFFDNTHDRNGNRRLDDELTHVAIVEALDADGTLHLVHLASAGVVRVRMNLEHPDTHKAPDGKVWNDFLRRQTSRDPKGTRYLSAQLYRGCASFWEAEGLRSAVLVDG